MVGLRIAQYQIEAPLGKGGMGEVWLARDLRLDRPVAMKLMAKQAGAESIAAKRFLREARLASSLSHPNIVAIYDVGESDGRDFIAMEYVAGETLASTVANGKLSPEVAWRIVQQIAEALALAHEAGIVHRDLKPANIMLTRTGLVKVLDFGLALRANAPVVMVGAEPGETQTQLTAAGTVLGTYGYMSPEQLLGEPADASSDIFSLGVVWFELVSGVSPFDGNSRSEQMRRMLSEGARDVRGLVKSFRGRDAELLMRCLRFKPEDRFRNAGELLEAMRRHTGMGVSPLVRSVVAAVLVLAGVGTAIVSWSTHGTGVPGLAATTVRGDLKAARDALERYDVPGRIETAIREAEAVLEREPDSAQAYLLLAQAKVFESYVARDELTLQQGERFARKAIELEGYLGAAHGLLGWVLSLSGKPEEAEAALRKGLQLDPLGVDSHLGMAHWAGKQGKLEQAEQHYRTAAQSAPGRWYVYAMAGALYYREGQYEKAAGAFERARQQAADNVRVLSSLASTYHHLGRNAEAISTLQRAIEIRPSGTLYSNLGTLLFFSARYDQAVPAMQRAVDLSPTDPTNWGNLADSLRWAPGRRAEAVKAYQTAISLVRARLEKAPEDVSWLSFLALYSAKAGDREEGLRLTARLSTRADLTPEQMYSLAVAAELLGKREVALSLLDRAVRRGYAKREVLFEPELAALRKVASYQSMAARWP